MLRSGRRPAYTRPIDIGRKLPRLKTSLTLLLPDGWKGEVVDVSAGGMKVRSLAFLAPGSEFAGVLRFEDGHEVPLQVVVAWATPPDHAAFQLAELGLELKDVPKEFLEALAGLFADAL